MFFHSKRKSYLVLFHTPITVIIKWSLSLHFITINASIVTTSSTYIRCLSEISSFQSGLNTNFEWWYVPLCQLGSQRVSWGVLRFWNGAWGGLMVCNLFLTSVVTHTHTLGFCDRDFWSSVMVVRQYYYLPLSSMAPQRTHVS